MSKRTVTIPAKLLPQMELWGKLTTNLFGELRRNAGLQAIPKDQEWYWSDIWQRWEREADEDIAAGRVKQADDLDDLFRHLDAL